MIIWVVTSFGNALLYMIETSFGDVLLCVITLFVIVSLF